MWDPGAAITAQVRGWRCPLGDAAGWMGNRYPACGIHEAGKPLPLTQPLGWRMPEYLCRS